MPLFHFNSRPHEEVDCFFAETLCDDVFISTHDLTKRSTQVPEVINRLVENFNSRPHEEVDTAYLQTPLEYRLFQLTTSRRGRPPVWRMDGRTSSISTHDLTKRSTGVSVACIIIAKNFNSRPHEEVDPQASDHIHQTQGISTHDLTKRSTVWIWRILKHCTHFNSRPHEEVDEILSEEWWEIDISTHDLTKRSTCWECSDSGFIFHFNSRPHEEVDAILWMYFREFLYFNSRPHEEVDDLTIITDEPFWIFQLTTSRRGRQFDVLAILLPVTISTHDLTKRSTRREKNMKEVKLHFNSRPHEEVDVFFGLNFSTKSISTHDLTKRSTELFFCCLFSVYIFQLTTSRRGRHWLDFLNRWAV